MCSRIHSSAAKSSGSAKLYPAVGRMWQRCTESCAEQEHRQVRYWCGVLKVQDVDFCAEAFGREGSPPERHNSQTISQTSSKKVLLRYAPVRKGTEGLLHAHTGICWLCKHAVVLHTWAAG
jgi:hypothetical protein